MQYGLGEGRRFDCSGFVLTAIADVLGCDKECFTDIRHCRQLYHLAAVERLAEGMSGDPHQYIGKLAIMQRRWTMDDGSEQAVPAHIGIITGVTDNNMPILLEAQASKPYKSVVERPLLTTQTTVGILAIEALCAHVQSLCTMVEAEHFVVEVS